MALINLPFSFFGFVGFSGGFSRGPSEEFDLSKLSLPLDQNLSGRPSKDEIPAIPKPVFMKAKEGGTGIGFHNVVNKRPLTFGVSGLLYQSDMVIMTIKQRVYGHSFLCKPLPAQ